MRWVATYLRTRALLVRHVQQRRDGGGALGPDSVVRETQLLQRRARAQPRAQRQHAPITQPGGVCRTLSVQVK
jgi:hypothetical protein